MFSPILAATTETIVATGIGIPGVLGLSVVLIRLLLKQGDGWQAIVDAQQKRITNLEQTVASLEERLVERNAEVDRAHEETRQAHDETRRVRRELRDWDES